VKVVRLTMTVWLLKEDGDILVALSNRSIHYCCAWRLIYCAA